MGEIGAMSFDGVFRQTRKMRTFGLSDWLLKRNALAGPANPEQPHDDLAFALFRLAAANGFLVGALAGVVRTAVSPYRKLRNTLGIAQYTEDQFIQTLRGAGFNAERLARNMEHNPARMTFRARIII